MTFPAELIAVAKLAIGDVLIVQIANGAIVSVPLVARIQRHSIADFVGIGNGVWVNSKQEVSASNCARRNSRER